MRKAGFFKGGRFMAKGLIHGESGDTLQMESAFLIKLLSRFSRFELFYLVRWKRAFPLVFRAALAALVCHAESTVLTEKAAIWRTMGSVPDTARWLWGPLCPVTGLFPEASSAGTRLVASVQPCAEVRTPHRPKPGEQAAAGVTLLCGGPLFAMGSLHRKLRLVSR